MGWKPKVSSKGALKDVFPSSSMRPVCSGNSLAYQEPSHVPYEYPM